MGELVGKIAVIGTDDSITFKDYHAEYEELCNIIASADGEHTLIEHFSDLSVPKVSNEMVVSTQRGIMWCNEEFLLIDDEKLNKFNPVASMLSGQMIYGDVALVIDDGEGGDLGFNEQEEELMKTNITFFCNEHAEELAELHQEYDGHENKPEPEFGFSTFTIDEDGNIKTDDENFGID